MNHSNQSADVLAAWQFTKGMVISNVALVTALIKVGSVSLSDVIEALDCYIEICANKQPDNLGVIEPIKMTKDMITTLYSENNELSTTDKAIWIADFVGQA